MKPLTQAEIEHARRQHRIDREGQEPEMDADEPTLDMDASKGILIGMMIGTAIWLAIALVLWFTFCGGE